MARIICAKEKKRTHEKSDPQKYKNSRYDKSSLLFGLERARKKIHKSRRVIVVEGYLDAMALWSFGLEETVACQGTALTTKHLETIVISQKLHQNNRDREQNPTFLLRP